MMRLPSRPRRSAHVLLAAPALGGGLTIVPAAAAAPVLPVLWEGRVHGADQAPTGAEVVAYARPPADALKRGVPISEIARTQAGQDGRFRPFVQVALAVDLDLVPDDLPGRIGKTGYQESLVGRREPHADGLAGFGAPVLGLLVLLVRQV